MAKKRKVIDTSAAAVCAFLHISAERFADLDGLIKVYRLTHFRIWHKAITADIPSPKGMTDMEWLNEVRDELRA